MAFISFNTRVAEHRTRLVCLGESPSPRVRCRLALFTYLLTYNENEFNLSCAARAKPGAAQHIQRLLISLLTNSAES